MVDTNHPAVISIGTLRHHYVEIEKCKPMVFIVISQDCHRWVVILNFGVEDELVPAQHLLEAASAVCDMRELDWADA